MATSDLFVDRLIKADAMKIYQPILCIFQLERFRVTTPRTIYAGKFSKSWMAARWLLRLVEVGKAAPAVVGAGR